MPAPVWGVAGSVTTAALAYSLWAGGYLGERRSRTKLILDGKHLRWLAEHCSKDFHTKSLVLERCISHAREADAAAVFEVARCGGGKKQKVQRPSPYHICLVDGPRGGTLRVAVEGGDSSRGRRVPPPPRCNRGLFY